MYETQVLTIAFALILLIYFAARAFQGRFRHLIHTADGPTAVEYVVMAAIVIMVCMRTKW
jgi:hypothetical protein